MRCARKAQYLLFNLFKAFDYIESSHKTGIFTRKDPLSFMRAQHVMSYHLMYHSKYFTRCLVLFPWWLDCLEPTFTLTLCKNQLKPFLPTTNIHTLENQSGRLQLWYGSCLYPIDLITEQSTVCSLALVKKY